MKIMEQRGYFENIKNHFNPLIMDKMFVFKTLSKGLEGFRDKFEIWKASFPVYSIRISKIFLSIPIMNHYCGS